MNLKINDRIELTSIHPKYNEYPIKRGYVVVLIGDSAAVVRMDWDNDTLEVQKGQYRIRR